MRRSEAQDHRYVKISSQQTLCQTQTHIGKEVSQMGEFHADAVEEGSRTARDAITNKVPRWLVMARDDDSQRENEIDSRTGLPIAVISAPRELEARQAAFVRAFNDVILRGIESGEII